VTLDQQVRELLAREAIRELPNRYCDCVWRGDAAGIAELFARDGSFTAIVEQGARTIRGRAELAAFFAAALDMQPRPYIHNHVVELVAEGLATGRCYLDLRSARQQMSWIGAGYYEDEYIATTDGWKIQSRRFHAVRMDEWPDALRQ